MHSIHNHAAYWLASIAARLVYELVAVWSGHRPLLQALLVPLTALALFFVWTGPNPCWKILGSRMYYVVAGCLLMTSGKPIYDVFGPDVATERAAHVLLGFTILGVLEPIRQNVGSTSPPYIPRIYVTRDLKVVGGTNYVLEHMKYGFSRA